MMKKTFIFVLTLVMLFSCTFAASATEQEIDSDVITEIEYFEDGSYAVTTLEIFESARATNTKTGSKTKTHYDSNGSVNFSVTLTASFSYTGSSATCTSATASKSISDSAWTVTTSTSRSGRTGTANYTGTQKALGVTIRTVSDSITISCSNTGVLS